MLNEVEDRLSIEKSSCMHSSRFIASGQPAGQEEKKGQEDILILPSCIARSTALESLLSVALSSVERLDCIIQFLFGDSGLTFVSKMGSFSIIILMSHSTNWVHFR